MKTLFLAIAIFNLGIVLPGHAASDQTKTTTPSKMEWSAAQRENMAKVHENMAACLRSSKSMADCRAEAHTSCQQMKDGCPMGGKGKGHHGGGMMWE